MSSSHSPPKRKRTSSSASSHSKPSTSLLQVQIPPTPPTSSPIEEADSGDSSEGSSTSMRHTINLNGVQVMLKSDEAGSPRTKVAYRFQGLQLEERGEVSKLSLDMQRSNPPKMVPRTLDGVGDNGEGYAVRKRMRLLERGQGQKVGFTVGPSEIPETPVSREKCFHISIGPERMVDPAIEESAKGVTLHNQVDPVLFKGSSGSKRGVLARAYPSINRLAESKSRVKESRRKAGLPPLLGAADASLEMANEIVDEERAALTWHDDEITGHDPSDPEDDGEGINGIGFRPTAAEAYARAQKRKQQMLAYKTREAQEARARRSEKRRGTEIASREEKEAERRVRFMEIEKASIVTFS